MKQLIILLICIIFASCAFKNIGYLGFVEEVRDGKYDTVRVQNTYFLVFNDTMKRGQYVTFMPTRDTAKVNSKKLSLYKGF